MKFRLYLLSLILTTGSYAQDFQLSNHFGSGGIYSLDFNANEDIPSGLILLPDGSLLVSAKGYLNAGGNYYSYIKTAKLSKHCGNPLSTYGTNGLSYFQYDIYSYVNDILVQPDGKIIGTGLESPGGAVSSFTPMITRLHADGTPDTTFNESGRFHDRFDPISGGEYFDSHYYEDGRVLAIGRSYSNINGGTLGIGLTRLHVDGTPDSTFAGDGRAVVPMYAFGPARGVVTEDGDIIVAAHEEIGGSANYVRMVKFDSLGNQVMDFAGDGILEVGYPLGFSGAGAFVFPTQDKIVLVAEQYANPSIKVSVTRYNMDGTPDLSFGTDGAAAYPADDLTNFYFHGASMDAEGRILASGTDGFIAVLVRFTPDGILDDSFGTNGVITLSLPNSGGERFQYAVMESDSVLWAVGHHHYNSSWDVFVARYEDPVNNWVDLGPDMVACEGESILLDAGNAGATFVWNTTEETGMITASETGEYSVIVTDEAECMATDTVMITFASPTIPVIVQAGQTLTTDAVGALQWFLNGEAVVGENGSSIEVSEGSYAVEVTDENGCTAMSSAVLITSVDEASWDFSVYPNPVTDSFRIVTPPGFKSKEVTLTDISGRIILRQQITPGRVEIEAGLLPPGVYLAKCDGQSMRIVKE